MGALRPIRASEVGRYGYCARAWWLQYVQGHAPQNILALERGQAAHEAHGQSARAAQRLLTLSRALLACAAMLAAALLYLTLSP